MTINQRTIGRRSVLRSAVTGLGAAMITTGISGRGQEERNAPMPSRNTALPGSAQGTPRPRHNRRVLLAYFSRAGENYYYGRRTDLDIGNTEVLAGMISKLVRCDLHGIAAVGEGFAVRGEEVRDAGPEIESRLRRIGLLEP
jgi:hypothetical protein